MRKTWAALAMVAVVVATATTDHARAGDIGPGLPFGVAAGVLPADTLTVFPYDGYVYGPLPYGPLPYVRADAVRGSYHSRLSHASRIHRGSRIHSVARIRHVTRTTYVFDPYYGGGPFYFHHYCCRYW